MSKQPHAALSLPVRGAERIPIGSGTLKKTEDALLDKVLKNSTSPTSSSTRSTSTSTSEFNEVQEMTTELQKTELNFLDQLESPERSICGGVQFADIDQHGGVYSARMPAQSVPGGSELLPGCRHLVSACHLGDRWARLVQPIGC